MKNPAQEDGSKEPSLPAQQKLRFGVMDALFGAIIIVLVCVLVFGVTRPVREPYVELYFDDHREIVNITNSTVRFAYVIHNAEMQDSNYTVRYIIDYMNTLNQSRQDSIVVSEVISVKDGERKVVEREAHLRTPFDRARVLIDLPQKKQHIHFWTRFIGNQVEYPQFGKVILDCLQPVHEVRQFSSLTLAAHASPGDGWPQLVVMHNGIPVATIAIESNITLNRSIWLENGEDNIIELVYSDDYYNTTGSGDTKVVVDRNVYIDGIWLGEQEIPRSEFMTELGLPSEWFDCQRTRVGRGDLYGPGALRLRYQVDLNITDEEVLPFASI